jgi:mono/diheme cytochrome c family protein
MKSLKYIVVVAILAVVAASCSQYSKDPGTAYMPDMAYSRAYEFYSYNPNYKNGITAQNPVTGTIARGAVITEHLKESDSLAYYAMKYNGTLSMSEIEEGGRIYNIHCGVCHGTALDGNGPLYNGGEGKYPAAPANFKAEKYLNMSVGQMYYAIMYGKNLMGSYSSQLDTKQRWMVLAYIKKIQSENNGAALSNSFTIADAATPSDVHTSVTDTAHHTTKVVEKAIDNAAKVIKDTVKKGKH